MPELLRLEYLFNRRQLLIILAILSGYFAFMAVQIDSPRVIIVTTCLIIGLSMPFTIMGREDKFKTAALVCSLPVRRSTIVLAKYAATWIALGLGLAYASLFVSIVPFTRIHATDVLTVRALCVSLFLMSLIFAFVLPFIIRFGLTGIIILLVGAQLLGVLALALTQLLGNGNNPLRAVIRAIEDGLRALLNHESNPGFLLALLAAALAVNVLSVFLSQALYARRDL
jgi:hypothetical protein